jgi:GMP synthase (glutamine-hydrolysing)
MARSARGDRAIRAAGGQGLVICGLSGGVDSSVVAVLLHEAIGDQLTCIFVDHGLLRERGRSRSSSCFRNHYNIALVARCVVAFSSALAGVADPEVKRKIIGKVFIDVFEEEATSSAAPSSWRKARSIPDVIESCRRPAGRPPRSSRITMSAGCPSACG